MSSINRLSQAQAFQVAAVLQKFSPEEIAEKTDQDLAALAESALGFTITSSNITSITKDLGMKTASRREAKPDRISDLEVMILEAGARIESLEAKVAQLEEKLEAGNPVPTPESDELVPVSSLLN